MNWKYKDGHFLWGRDYRSVVMLHPAVEQDCFFVTIRTLDAPHGTLRGKSRGTVQWVHADQIDRVLAAQGFDSACIDSGDAEDLGERWTANPYSFPAVRTSRQSSETCVYFVRAASGDIKIGYTSNLEHRLSSLQNASSERLAVIGTLAGDRDLERALHARFAHLRKSGEWFAAGADLLSYVDTLSADRMGDTGKWMREQVYGGKK